MTTKNIYVKIAKKIKIEKEKWHNSLELALIQSLALDISLVFSEDNPKFSPDKFMTACGFDPKNQ